MTVTPGCSVVITGFDRRLAVSAPTNSARFTGSRSAGASASSLASVSRSPTMASRRSRLPSSATPVRRQSASAGYSMASSTWTRMAVIGLRRSCEASATNLRCRSTACSSRAIGVRVLVTARDTPNQVSATSASESPPRNPSTAGWTYRGTMALGRVDQPVAVPLVDAQDDQDLAPAGEVGQVAHDVGYGRRCRRRAPAGSCADGRSGSPSWTPRARPSSRPGSRPPRR